MSQISDGEKAPVSIDLSKILRLGGAYAGRSNTRMVGGKMIGLRVEPPAPVVLNPEKLLLLGGPAKVPANTRMIGTKWSPTSKS